MQHPFPTKCRYFNAQNPSSCTNGSKCQFSHDAPPSRPQHQPIFSEPHHKYDNKRPTHPIDPHQPRRQARREDLLMRNSSQREDVEPQTDKRLSYINSMMESLKRKCLKCKRKEHLVLTSCGCQQVCSSCARESTSCPKCQSRLFRGLFIGAFE